MTGVNAAGVERWVCVIHENVSFGGMELHTDAMLDTLVARGYRIELILNHESSLERLLAAKPERTEVTVVRTAIPGYADTDACSRVAWRKVFGALRSRELILPKGMFNYGSIAFLWECRRWFKRIVYIEHMEAAPLPPKRSRWHYGVLPGVGLWWYRERLVRHARSLFAHRIVAVSDGVKRSLVTRCGYAPVRIEVARNGIDSARYLRSAEAARGIRDRLGIPPGTFVFGMLARLHRQKGIDVALHAFRHLLDTTPGADFRVLIVGEGQEERNLRELSQKLALDSHVQFAGFVPAPAEMLPAFDSILMPSRSEGLPLALLEGMAAGCVPIVTRVGGMVEVIAHASLGWVVEPEDPVALGVAMTSAMRMDETLRETMRECVRQHVREHFELSRTNERLLGALGLVAA